MDLMQATAQNPTVARILGKGIKEGDVMMKLDATDLTGLQSFSEFLKTAKAGQTVTVSIMRDGKPLTLSVTLVER